MKLLLDVDGVLADFVTAACKAHSRPNPYDYPENFGDYFERIWGMSLKEFFKPFDCEFWTNLPLMPAAKDIVSVLEDHFGLANICLLTAPVLTFGCLEGKRKWIQKNFPQYSNQWLIGPNKTFTAHRDSLLIDDHETNCSKFFDAGGRAFLLPAPWNCKYEQDPFKAISTFVGNLRSMGEIF